MGGGEWDFTKESNGKFENLIRWRIFYKGDTLPPLQKYIGKAIYSNL